MKSDQTPYKLGYSVFPPVGEAYIYVAGPSRVLDDLLRWPGTEALDDPRVGRYVKIPPRRAAFLAAEALASPASVSDAYRQARDTFVSPLSIDRDRVSGWLREAQFRYSLLDHQLDFCTFAHDRIGTINACEQGLGKTVMGWAMVALWRPQRVLIVAPKSVIPQWSEAWTAAWGSPRPIACALVNDGTKARRRERLLRFGATPEAWPIAVVLNWEVVADLREPILDYHPDLLILDEAHKAKNPRAEVTKACIDIADAAERVMLLTGSPIGNDIGDLWSLLRIAKGADFRYKSYGQFVGRFAETALINVGPTKLLKITGCSDPAALMEEIEPVWFRACKESCLSLPPKSRRKVMLDLPADTRALYDNLRKHGTGILGDSLALDSERVVLTRLQQITSGFRPVWDGNGSDITHEERQAL